MDGNALFGSACSAHRDCIFDRRDGKFRPNSAIVLLIVFNRETPPRKDPNPLSSLPWELGCYWSPRARKPKSTPRCSIRQTMHKSRVVGAGMRRQFPAGAASTYSRRPEIHIAGRLRSRFQRRERIGTAADDIRRQRLHAADGGIHDGQHAVGRRPRPAFVSGRKQHQFPNRR